MKTASEIRILIVDDSSLSRRHARDRLAPHGYQTQEASGPEEALAILGKEEFDLVLLDLLMPGVKDPVDIVSRVNAAAPDTLIIVVSANVQARVQEAVLAAGAVGFIAKPVQAVELQLLIETSLGAG